MHYRATVLLPRDWSIDNDTVNVQDAAFVYNSKIEAVGRRFTAEYDFRTLADHVDAARVPEYARNLERVRDDVGYQLTSGGNAAQPQSTGSINICPRSSRRYSVQRAVTYCSGIWPARPAVQPIDPSAPSGIAGWLLLPLLNVCLLPIVIGQALYQYRPHLDTQTWNAVGEGVSDLAIQLLQLGHFTLVASAVALLMAACYTAFLFFNRRRSFPFTWVLLLWAWVAWLFLDLILVIGLPDENRQDITAAAVAFARSCIFSLIWTIYMRRSQRVAATFIRDGATPASAPASPAALPSQTAT